MLLRSRRSLNILKAHALKLSTEILDEGIIPVYASREL